MNELYTGNLAYRRTAEPATRVVSIDEAQLFLKLDELDTERETEIGLLIDAATHLAERLTNRQLITAPYQVQLPSFYSTKIHLPKPRLLSVTSVQYYDSSNALQTLSSDEYFVSSYTEPGYIEAVDTFPATYARPDAVSISYQAGYGSQPSSVPAALRAAVLVLVAHLDTHRAGGEQTSTPDLPPNAEFVLKQFAVNYI